MMLASEQGFLLLFSPRLSWAPPYFSSWLCNSSSGLNSLQWLSDCSSCSRILLSQLHDSFSHVIQLPNTCPLSVPLVEVSLLLCPTKLPKLSCLLPTAATIPMSMFQPILLFILWIPIWSLFWITSWCTVTLAKTQIFYVAGQMEYTESDSHLGNPN